MDPNDVRKLLEQKLAILSKVAANCETQRRFIRRHEMRGLRRLLRERAALLAQLADVNRQLAGLIRQNLPDEAAQLLPAVTSQQVAVLKRSRQVLEEARLEREQIGAELKNITMRQQIQKKYLAPRWVNVIHGKRFNAKG